MIGTFPGWGYAAKQTDTTKRFFAETLAWTGKEQHVRTSDDRLIARLHVAADSIYLWIVNSTRETLSSELCMSEQWGNVKEVEKIRGRNMRWTSDGTLAVNMPPRDVFIAKLIR